MDGDKLILLKNEITHYLGIPYFSNTNSKVKSSENALVGKGTAREIALKTIEMANGQNLKLTTLSDQQIYNFQKKNKIGIDCSGLAYNLLQFLDPSIDQIFIGTEGKKGVRRVSANLLTSIPNSTPVTDWETITTGDLIRVNRGKHVLFVVERDGNTITFVDSSQKNTPKGVAYGKIDLKKLSQYDGVFRPNLKI